MFKNRAVSQLRPEYPLRERTPGHPGRCLKQNAYVTTIFPDDKIVDMVSIYVNTMFFVIILTTFALPASVKKSKPRRKAGRKSRISLAQSAVSSKRE